MVCAVTGLSSAALVAALAFPLGAAHADPQPHPVFPSADQVANAKAAAASAGGSVADLDARLSSLRDTVTNLQQAAGDAGEAANGAQLALDDATKTSADTQAKADTAQTASDAAALTLSRYAAEVYQGGGDTSQLDVFFGGGGPQAVLDRAAGVDAVGGERAQMVSEAESAKLLAQNLRQQSAEAAARHAAAAAAAKSAMEKAEQAAQVAETQTAQLETQQQQLTVQLATLQNTSVQLEQQRQVGLAAEEERRREEANRLAAEAAARAAAQAAAQKAASEAAARAAAAALAEQSARTAREQAAAAARAAAAQQAASVAAANVAVSAAPATKSKPSTASTPRPPTPRPPTPTVKPPVATNPPPAVAGGVAAVIAFARAQLGKPYVWAGAGPNVWDCSGLTMVAWRQAGVNLSHYAPTQYTATAHIPIAQLQPGDLVFYGTSGATSHHVALYIGGGMMIQAPHTGDVVKISSIYSMSDLVPYGGRP